MLALEDLFEKWRDAISPTAWTIFLILASVSLLWHIFLVLFNVYWFFASPEGRASGAGHSGSRGYSLWRAIAVAIWKDPQDPTIHGVVDLDVTEAEKALDTLRSSVGDSPFKPTWTHVITYCVVKAIRDNPRINARVHLGRVIPHPTIDVFMQVAMKGDSLSGIAVKDAGDLDVTALAAAVGSKSRALKAGNDKVFQKTLSSLAFVPSFLMTPVLRMVSVLGCDIGVNLPSLGIPKDPFGTVQVTSLGMHGGFDLGFAPFFPLARAPLILLVPAVADKPIVVDGKVVPRRILSLCATLDHRVADGVLASRIAGSIREHLKSWTASVLDKKKK